MIGYIIKFTKLNNHPFISEFNGGCCERIGEEMGKSAGKCT